MTAPLASIWVREIAKYAGPAALNESLPCLGTTYSCVANYEGSSVEISKSARFGTLATIDKF
jgi:hypothetical protein